MLKRWAISSFTADTDTELLEALADAETVIFSLFIVNNEASDPATITFTHTDTDGATTIFQWAIEKLTDESPTVIDSPIVMQSGDKLLVQSNKANVSVLANGEVK
jgi:hypothetical protein